MRENVFNTSNRFRDYLFQNSIPYSEIQSFSGSVFFLNAKKFKFKNHDKKKYIFLSSKIKSKVSKNIKIENLQKIENSFLNIKPVHIFNNKNAISGYYYDINNAYGTLNSLFVGKDLTELLIKEKEKGININKAIGYSYLGTKYHYEYCGTGSPVLIKTETNKYRNLFMILRYICISLIKKICDFYSKYVIAYYIDAVIFSEKTFFENKINDFFQEVFFDFEKKIIKKYNFYFVDLIKDEFRYDFLKQFMEMKITFKEKYIESIIWEETNGIRSLTFYRDGKKVHYRNIMKNIF